MFRNFLPKTTRLIRSTFIAAVATWLLLAAVGCGCKPETNVKALQIIVSRDAALNDKLVSVALFAVRDDEMAKWRGPNAAPATTVMQPSGMGPENESAIKRIYFAPEDVNRVIISPTDDFWPIWRSREGWTLIAVADTEPTGTDKTASRSAFSIDACDWKKRVAVVELFVDENGIRSN